MYKLRLKFVFIGFHFFDLAFEKVYRNWILKTLVESIDILWQSAVIANETVGIN
jgi:hypothetical protein